MGIKKGSKSEKKSAYDRKLCQLLDEYTKVLIAFADNVGSKQLQDIRKGLRGDSVVLMGKNTLIRRCIKVHAERTGNKDLKRLGELLVVSRLYFFSSLVRLCLSPIFICVGCIMIVCRVTLGSSLPRAT
jgi:ribosomal protein L10